MEKLSEDPKLLSKLSEYKNDIEGMYKYLTTIVDGYSFDEFKDFVDTIPNTNIKGELNDENLESVSGGIITKGVAAYKAVKSLLSS